MAYLVGVVLALSAALFATFVGLDRDRAFYPTVMIVIALTYALFSVMGGSLQTLAIECLAILAFLFASVAGFRISLWFVAAGLATHGVFDLFHGHLIANPGVPTWWPEFCLAYDLMAAAYLAWLLLRSRLRAAIQNRCALHKHYAKSTDRMKSDQRLPDYL
jgi:hypothetical protein